MCEHHQHGDEPVEHRISSDRGIMRYIETGDLVEYARFLATQTETRRTATGFIGYGATKPGDRVLVVIDNHYDPQVPDAVARALREKGAKVDIMTADIGPDKEFDEIDEIYAIIRREPCRENPRRWDYIPWVEDLAHLNKYDLVIHGKGGPIPKTPFRYECIPWLQPEQLASSSNLYPRELSVLINEKTWHWLWLGGRGGKLHLTDPEGTDLTWTLKEEYYEGRNQYLYGPSPVWGHLMGHGITPIVKDEDATGYVRGTTSHFSRPFPSIELTVDHGQVVKTTGGGRYGQAWRELIDETKTIQYPFFPRPGMFWLQEVAIGTNPKVIRPQRNFHMHSSGGCEIERRRSGIIHLGFGTFWQSSEEDWAAERRVPYGHLHVHLLLATMEITTRSGETVRIIDRGRLTSLDDPEVRNVASKYGDPDELLKEDWIPIIPGISAPGEYADYARDPASFIYGRR